MNCSLEILSCLGPSLDFMTSISLSCHLSLILSTFHCLAIRILSLTLRLHWIKRILVFGLEMLLPYLYRPQVFVTYTAHFFKRFD